MSCSDEESYFDLFQEQINFENDIADDPNDYYPSDYSSDDGRYDISDDEPHLCISCNEDYYPLKSDGQCERCWRSAFTLFDLSTLHILPEVLINNIFSFLGIDKIDHEKRVKEYKSRYKICWRFEKHGKCKLGDYCRFVHVVKNPKVCRHFLKGRCHFGNICRFTHRRQKKCKWFLKGKCHFGNKCFFTHKK
jgi:hypothetical protein